MFSFIMIDSGLKLKTNSSLLEPLKTQEDWILAAIDIGTNSIHMVVVEINPKLATFTIIAREKDTVRLGERNLKTGELTPEAIKRALIALERCQELAISLKAKDIVAVATSAVREAPNGIEFIDKIKNKLGLEVALISGQEEARRIYLGVLSGMDFATHPHIIIDIGGGSTELILADTQEARFLSSTKVGAVRLTREFISTDPISIKEFNYLQAYVRGMLERPVDQIKAALKKGEKPRLVGTSGTIESLAQIHAIKKSGSAPNPFHGYEVSLEDLQELTEELAQLNYQARSNFPGMLEKRAEIIVAGAVILTEAMLMLGVDKIVLCERALREGIIVDWMLTNGFIEDKLHYQSEVCQRSVYALADKYQVKLDYSERVANFAVSLFDQLEGKLHHWGAKERNLLWAAAILHNSGLYISHSAHHKHSYYLIRNGELLGFTETEVEILANIARYHRKSKPKKKHQNYQNLGNKQERKRVDELSAILRLAVALDRRQIGAVEQVVCEYHPHHKEVELRLIPTSKNDDCDLELWNLSYKKEVFEQEFGVKVVARLGE